jgi:acetyl-CoA acetyltransferase
MTKGPAYQGDASSAQVWSPEGSSGVTVRWAPGPCIGMDTACSSSLVATHLAAAALAAREASSAVAAGVNLILVPQVALCNCPSWQSRMCWIG